METDMVIDYKKLVEMLTVTASLLRSSEGMLTQIDSQIGDGDHGVAILKVATIIENECAKDVDGRTISSLLEDISYEISSTVGGSTGPLWGAYFEGLGSGTYNCSYIDEAVLKKMFHLGFKCVDDISGAKEGDKTMMDALIPASRAIEATSGGIGNILKVAAAAGAAGATNSAGFVARFGRAKELKERAIGYRDAGAVSISVLLAGLSQAVHGNN